MAFKFGSAAAKVAPTPIPNAVMLPDSKVTDQLLVSQARNNEVTMAVEDMVLDQKLPPVTEEAVKERVKLSRLVADDFPFDESQLAAIEGIASQQYACLTGAAGTGKTTSTKAIVDRIQDSIGHVNMKDYFKRVQEGTVEADEKADAAESDDGSDAYVPSICLVGFTGRSSQMIKKNFPRDWHKNIMTIHRMLAFVPDYYEDFDPDMGSVRTKMRFIPTYTKFCKLPWDVIVIDEAGMVSVDLWEQVWDAAKEGCRIIMIGDINQLPPVHGRSIFGFAMTKWPSWELTHIHRQTGVNNSIVDNAWRILKGQKPISDEYQSDPGWKFAMMPIPEDSVLASQKIRKWLAAMNGKAYQPNRDSVITAINGEDMSKGYALGQIPMNRELAVVFNKDSPRYIIDAGRERKQFAEGDKVMATRNDHEAGITNGMTGIITKIERNGGYAGDYRRFGTVDEVSAYMAEIEEHVDDEEFSLDDIAESYGDIADGMKDAKEKKDRGPASHIVTVRFGDGEHAFEMPFGSLAEVATLMTAYVVTCHKMQGGESPMVIVILHQAHKQMLNREWLYTAVTRASGKCVLFFTDLGLRAALNKQRITGKTLSEKVKVFQELQTRGIAGAAVSVYVPEPLSLSTSLVVPVSSTILEQQPVEQVRDASKPNPFAEQLKRAKDRVQIDINVTHTHVHHTVAPPPPPKPVDGGMLKRVVTRQDEIDLAARLKADREADKIRYAAALNKPMPKYVVPSGPVRTLSQAARPAPKLLTYQPQTIESVPQVAPKKVPFKFGVKK